MSASLSVDGNGVCRVAGDLDFAGAGALHGRGGEVLAAADDEITLDLSGVPSAATPGIALLLDWHRRAHAQGKRLSVTGLADGVRRVARRCGVEDLVEAGADATGARRRGDEPGI